MKLIAKTLAGLEPVLAEEIEHIGGKNVKPGIRAVYFEGSKQVMYRANLQLRTALRILQVIDEFRVHNEEQLYKKVKHINWPHYMSVQQTLAVDAVTNSDQLRHSKYVALKTKDAIVDRFRDETGHRPNVNVFTPTLRIHVHILDKDCTVALDSSGDSLHKRGYREQTLEAPINEVLAAGMILLSGWTPDQPLVDPMCGSGTIPIEAALIARGIPPGLFKEQFGFERWNNYDAAMWKALVDEAQSSIKTDPIAIYGYDKNFKAVKIAQMNAQNARLEGQITFERKAFQQLEPPAPSGVIIMNPPYDERLGIKNINALYQMVGDQLKQQFQGYEAWILSSNKEALKEIGLRTSRKLTLFNGPLECKFQKYELYAGSKKQAPAVE